RWELLLGHGPEVAPHTTIRERLVTALVQGGIKETAQFALFGHAVELLDAKLSACLDGELRDHERLATGQTQGLPGRRHEVLVVVPRRPAIQRAALCKPADVLR